MSEKLEVRLYPTKYFNYRFPRPRSKNTPCVQPSEVCGNRIFEVTPDYKFDSENRPEADALITADYNRILEIYGNDCLILAGKDHQRFGVCHMRWREFIAGFLTDFISEFSAESRAFIVGPFMHRLAIMRDAAYEDLHRVLGEEFFTEDPTLGLVFEFKKAVEAALKAEQVDFYAESTTAKNLASARAGCTKSETNILRVGAHNLYDEDDCGIVLDWPFEGV